MAVKPRSQPSSAPQVVPFSQRSGVLEWCSGTVPIGQFLVGPDQGAHKRFRPQDWSNVSCRRKMMVEPLLHRRGVGPGRVLLLCCRSSQAAAGFDEKLRAYSEVCKNFRPVFRFFCMERFLDPAVWMEKRLAYTRSVATSSIGTLRKGELVGGSNICTSTACPELLQQLHQFCSLLSSVGYMVGLGDRHIQNILIDERSAELVHIDLGTAPSRVTSLGGAAHVLTHLLLLLLPGVAFEQGKTLPTPETVPFRLSRDIVDGMGVTGVEGVFRR